jgi:UDP-glucose 4-epimerase
LCAKFKKKVLIASTSEVYGKRGPASKQPFRETDDCIYGPSVKSRWSYAASKLMDEFAALAYYRTKGLPVLIVRFFNTVGPRQTGRYGMVIPRFVGQALRGEPITIYGDGTQTRTFTHVREVVNCVMKLIDSPKAVGQVVNVGGVEEISIVDLARRILEMTGSKSPLKFIPYSEAYPADFEDMQWRVPSTDKLREMIGTAPALHLHDILKDIIASAAH